MILTLKDPEVFDALASGKKRYEGRRWEEKYEGLSPGDYVLFLLEGGSEILLARIRDVKRYPSIEEMVKDLWRELLPFKEGPEEVLKYYKSFYSPQDPAVAIGIEPVQSFALDYRYITKWLGLSLPERLRVAIGVEGENLYEGHFGDAPLYKIYECSLEGCKLVEERENTTFVEEEEEHEHHHGNPAKFRAVLNLLNDVDVWCAFRMGPNYLRIVRESDKIPFLTGTRDLDRSLEILRRKFLSLALRKACRQ